ncbi:PKD domain-containing protein [Algoriphagus litoralis]|uniref:PKD domain-containing protein n=1 Tax=Algoriphagus litoralis TaxID=2202829 RepID=UPI0018E51AD1|nr:PKD domain-containing protein [Algoriphagus litoralis]
MQLIFCLLIFFFFSSDLLGQVRVPFVERASQNNPTRKTYDIQGDFALIGNTNLTLENYSDFLMNDNMLIYVDVDGDPNTINSSSATLNFSKENGADPNCSQILFAGLYWSGRGPVSDEFEVTTNGFTNKKLNRKQVLLKGPSGSSQVFTANENAIRYTYGLDLPNDLGLFVGFVEVTDFVKNNGQGEYTVADLAAIEGTNYHYGGWSMVVVYENPAMQNRSITVFDGYAFVRGSVVADYTIPISGFATVDSGPVRMKLGFSAGEGDVGATGDYFEIEKGVGSGEFVRLSHLNNSEDNFFNSSISTGGNSRNPELKNNTGMDISVFDIPNANNEILKNDQTSTLFRYGTDGDAYVIYTIVTAVETNRPLVEGFHFPVTDSGADLSEIEPLEEIDLVVEIRNKGDIPIENAILKLDIPDGLEFISEESEYFFSNPNGRAPVFNNGILSWELGDLPIPSSIDEVLAKITYKVRVTGQCDILLFSCGGSFVLNGSITGFNSISGSPLTTASLKIGENEGGNCLDSPIFGPLELLVSAGEYLKQECGYDETSSLLTLCHFEPNTNVGISELNNWFPSETRFFNSFPITESTIEYLDELPYSPNLLYFAIQPNYPNCPKEFRLQSANIEINVEVEEAECGTDSGLRLVKFNAIDQGVQLSFDYLDGNGFVQESSREFAVGKHKVIVLNELGCQRELEFEVNPSTTFNIEVQKMGDGSNCLPVSDFSLSILIESDLDDTFSLIIEGTTADGLSFNLTKQGLAAGLFEFDEVGAGEYQVSVQNNSGCIQTSDLTIDSSELSFLEGKFDWESTSTPFGEPVLIGELISFKNFSKGSGLLDFVWDFGDGGVSSEFEPQYVYDKPGTYVVLLTVSSSDGCIQEYRHTIEVGGAALRVPDAFTPDQNGENDYFFPVLRQVDSLRFWIFDRWGELVYYTDSPSDQGWDGSYRGIKASGGTYIYRVEYWTSPTQSVVETGSFILFR